jgi:hypothetical protein
MLEISLTYYPPELDVPATYAAQVGAIQAVGSSPSEALEALGKKLDRFPRPLVGAPAPIWEA